MKTKKSNTESSKSRRSFFKSAGAFIAGLGVFRPLFSFTYLGSADSSRNYKPAGRSGDGQYTDKILPDGVKAVWELSKAYHETTPSQERICINGLWRWQPGTHNTEQVPVSGWGYFKVPGNWPGLRNYLQRESQTLFTHPAWKNDYPANTDVAWYEREITIPETWAGRRIVLALEYLHSRAVIYINGSRAGEVLFPEGELDLTSLCSSGNKYLLSIKVTAIPLQDVVAIFSDSNSSRQGKGAVIRRGLCGDIFLKSQTINETIGDVQIITSFRKKEITFRVRLENLSRERPLKLHFSINSKGNEVRNFTTDIFSSEDLDDSCFIYSASWLAGKLWDIHTPENMYDCTVSLFGKDDILLDMAFNRQFGYREFWIEGRDFYLNGTRIHLSAVPLDNALVGAALANYEAASESMRRLMSFGINFVYTHNYGCEPGTHLAYNEILRAADDVGMLISFSQPHFGQYDWTAPDADQKNAYVHHARFYAKVAGNHPSVVFYSMSHNACGYADDMNPDRIDGLGRTDSSWSANNVKKALRAEAIVAGLDPGRIIYHHSSGNLSAMHTTNFYPNWVPVQELSDWFEHWATEGVKPLFLCEFGAPFTWDWGLYRGWFKGKRAFGSAAVPWEFCLAEWNSQFLGDESFKISDLEKANLRWEANRFKEGGVWYRWDYPYSFGSSLFNERIPILMEHLTEQWRAFRTWGMSANSPWDFNSYWQLQSDPKDQRKNLPVDWDHLQRPGYSADFTERNNRMDLDVAYDQADWMPTAANALMKNNMPLLACISGKPEAFTSKDHNFLPGTKVKKQLIVINNSRTAVGCTCNWSLSLPGLTSGRKTINLETGEQIRIPIEFDLPASLSPGNYKMDALVRFSTGEKQEDSFEINVLPEVAPIQLEEKMALFDPKGETQKLLDRLGQKYQTIGSGASLDGYDIVIIGKEALTVDGDGLNIESVRKGLKVIMFEQTSEVLEKRLGFRTVEYGLRKVFTRIPDHPAMEGLDPEHLHDWRGASTITSPRLKYETDDHLFNGAPVVRWCDIPVTNVWRCGNRGNVASVLIEKPTCGNFLPLLDGGYSLQYSPLMEYQEGEGMVLFCQMDVTGRTETEPVAEKLVRNLIYYGLGWKAKPKRQSIYVGNEPGFKHLQNAGMTVFSFDKNKLKKNQLIIAGPGSGNLLLSSSTKIKKWIKSGGSLLAIGFNQEDADVLLPFKVLMKKEEHIASYFDPFGLDSPFAGIGPADVHNRDPKDFLLISDGANIAGNGVLAEAENASMVFCQLIPWENEYGNGKHNVKQTYRRSSFLLSRLLGNMGVESKTPLLGRFNNPVDQGAKENRWLQGLYMDQPEEWDYPYRFFRW